ncbi:MAG: hypothetical protein ACFB10_20275 [Salibacteraceae bacterium]
MEEQNQPQPVDEKAGAKPVMTEEIMAQLRLEQNLPAGVAAAAVAALIGAILWAVISVATGYQIGYMAIAVGFIVGFAIRQFGKGVDPVFGIVGAALALFGCYLGNCLMIVGFEAEAVGMGFMDALNLLGLSTVISLPVEYFEVMDLLFYGIAGYEGYQFAFRKVTEEELAGLQQS